MCFCYFAIDGSHGVETAISPISPYVFVFVFLFAFLFVFVFVSKLKQWGGAGPLLEAPLRLIGPFPKQPLCTHSNDRVYAHTPVQ